MKRVEIEQLLPEIIRRTVRPGAPITALLDVMEHLHQPSEALLLELDRHFDPARCGDSMAPYLSGWVDLDWLLSRAEGPSRKVAGDSRQGVRFFAAGTGRLRQLIARAYQLSQWRGTRRGLLLFLETATGLKGFRIDEQPADSAGLPQPFHLRVVAPANARPLARTLHKIIEQERPVFVTFELQFEAPVEALVEKPVSKPRPKAKPQRKPKPKPKSKPRSRKTGSPPG